MGTRGLGQARLELVVEAGFGLSGYVFLAGI
jgi:hypothetical protein